MSRRRENADNRTIPVTGMEMEDSENIPLLNGRVQNNNGVARSTWLQILGGVTAIFASLVFAYYNYLVKYFKLDFLDVLTMRAVCQVAIFGTYGICSGQRFLPKSEDCRDANQFKLKTFLLVLQVSFINNCILVLKRLMVWSVVKTH